MVEVIEKNSDAELGPQDVVYTAEEVFRMCPYEVWMEVLQRLDVASCRRLTRVSTDWKANLLDVPRHNKGILHLSIRHPKTIGWINSIGSLGCLEGVSCWDWDSECQFLPKLRTEKEDPARPDRAWWCNILGVRSLSDVHTLVLGSASGGERLADLAPWMGTWPGVDTTTDQYGKHSLLKCANHIPRLVIWRDSSLEIGKDGAYIWGNQVANLVTALIGSTIGCVEFRDCKLRLTGSCESVCSVPRLVLDVSTKENFFNHNPRPAAWMADAMLEHDCCDPSAKKG